MVKYKNLNDFEVFYLKIILVIQVAKNELFLFLRG